MIEALKFQISPDSVRIQMLENRKEMTKEYIDDLLEWSIFAEHPELTAYLLDFKRKNNLYQEPDWSL